MKKLFPYVLIAAFAVLSFIPSCKKSDSPSTGTCTCTYKFLGTDTTVKFTGQVKTTCDSEQTLLRMLDSAATCTFN